MPDVLFEGRRFRVIQQTHATPDGVTHVRETIEHPGSVVLLPLVAPDQVCLIRNLRVAVGETLIELPAGTLDHPGEDPLECARRELAEETGYRAAKLEKLLDFYVSPGIMRERMHLFLASDLAPGDMHLDAGEQIEKLVVPWHEALAMVHDGRIHDAKTLVGLLYYDRFYREK
jgi:ADP-ribose pyrophosphatase